MTQLEMKSFDTHFDPEDTEMSAQEHLLYNNNYSLNHNNHNHNHNNHNDRQHQHHHHHHHHHDFQDDDDHQPLGEEENPYQIPYAHLQQHPYLQHQQQLQQQQNSYSSDDHMGSLPPPHINGHGPYRDKYSMAYPIRDDASHMGHYRSPPRSTGSGIVYRPRRRLWWLGALLLFALVVLAGAVVIAVYFTVLKPEIENQAALAAAAAHNSSQSPPVQTPDFPEAVTRQPPYVVPGQFSSTAQPLRPFFPNSQDIQVQRFDAYWHPGDSRLFVATLTNGTVIQAFGPKKSDGIVKSLYSLSLLDPMGVATSVRFQGQRNLASVVLPSGAIVNYDWASNKIEVKVFEVSNRPRGPDPSTWQQGPTTHLALVEVGPRYYILRQISKVMAELRSLRDTPMAGNRPRSAKCFSRFPLKVTKCSGKFHYNGAFVLGEITGIAKPITMAALPWPKEADPCYGYETGSNYYLPLPGYVDNDNATMIKDAFMASTARHFTELCNVVSDQFFAERHNLCSDMAEKVRKELKQPRLLPTVYDSCSAILNSLHTACLAVSGISAADNMPSFTEAGLLSSLNLRLSDSFAPGLPQQVDLRAHVFCPSSEPFSSYQTTVSIHTIRGNIVKDVIEINCPDFPEVIKVELDHLQTKSDLLPPPDQNKLIKHKMTICSICAFEKTMSAQIKYDEMMCNNTCTKTNILESIPSAYSIESKTFENRDSVYCHDFLTTVDNQLGPLGPQCLGNCMSHLHVQFKIDDKRSGQVFYEQIMRCSALREQSCKMKFGG